MADLIDARLERQLQRPISRLLRLKNGVSKKVCVQKTGPLIGEVRRAASGAMPNAQKAICTERLAP
jgi:hypothetical protein